MIKKLKPSGWDIATAIMNIVTMLVIVWVGFRIANMPVTETQLFREVVAIPRFLGLIGLIIAIFQFRYNRKNGRSQRANWFTFFGFVSLMITNSFWIFIFLMLSVVLYIIASILCFMPKYKKDVSEKVQQNHISTGYQKPSFGIKKEANGFVYKKTNLKK